MPAARRRVGTAVPSTAVGSDPSRPGARDESNPTSSLQWAYASDVRSSSSSGSSSVSGGGPQERWLLGKRALAAAASLRP